MLGHLLYRGFEGSRLEMFRQTNKNLSGPVQKPDKSVKLILRVAESSGTGTQGCRSHLTFSNSELTQDHVLQANVMISSIVTINAVNRMSGGKNCCWLPFNKHAMNIFI